MDKKAHRKYRLRDVFTPGGMPSITYVNRENLGLEKKLKDALSRGHSIITVSGPTKSGKTVLCRTVVGQKSAVWIDGGRVKTAADFWDILADQLNVADTTTASKTSSQDDSDEVASGFAVGFSPIAKAKAGGTSKSSKSRGAAMSKSYRSDVASRCIKYALENEIKIVIDDFHFLESGVQKTVVNSLKSAIFDGLDVIVIAVPHRAFDPLTVQQEMQGRFIHVEVTNWSDDELRQIPESGFPVLNVNVDPALIDKICVESVGNPLLAQDLCFRLCSDSNIIETQESLTVILGDLLEKICISVAENSGFPIFERLARGPQSRKERRMRPLKRGGEVDTYQAILLAVAENGAKAVTSYDEIRASLREILDDGGLPQKNEVTSACGHMSSIARNELENVEPIEWHNDSLVISDPFLLFYMRWRKEDIWQKLAPR
jgi:cytidylate kinase